MATNDIHPNIKKLFAQPEGSVLAVRVRKVDPPQYIADDIEDLLDRSSRFWDGEQCDSCGCSWYTIERDSTFPDDIPEGWTVRCSGNQDVAEEYADGGADAAQVEAVRNGCGARYRLRWQHESQVQF